MIFDAFLMGLAIVLALVVEREHRKRIQAESRADRDHENLIEAINQCEHQGSTLKRWDRPTKHNKADEFYWLVRISTEDYLFTDEALGVACDRAVKMRERGYLE